MVVWLILKCDVVTTVASWVTRSTSRRGLVTTPADSTSQSQRQVFHDVPWNHQGHVDFPLFLSFKRSLEICLVAGTIHATAADVFRTDANKQCSVTAMAFFFDFDGFAFGAKSGELLRR